MTKVMLLGGGELGREIVISLKRLGCRVVVVDSYDGAPAMQVADLFEVADMLDYDHLMEVIRVHDPDYIVPEIEAINTEALLICQDNGYDVVPSARAVDLTMNRDRIRDRAAELGIRTAKFDYAESEEQLVEIYNQFQSKVVVKPVMSSSGKGQTVVDVDDEISIRSAWHQAMERMRGDRPRVIIEEFIDFDYEITLLTVQQNEQVMFCNPIVHFQKNGDYQWSEQDDFADNPSVVIKARQIAKQITSDLTGNGIFGVEFFVTKDGEVIFSELSPRPHDTGMVTMYTQDLSQFDLHARAFLNLPIPQIVQIRGGASHVVCADAAYDNYNVEGVQDALSICGTDVRVFNKPMTYKNRRMAVVLAPTVQIAQQAASRISIVPSEDCD